MKHISLLALFISASSALSPPSFEKRQANSAIASSAFRRRAYHSSAVLDGWLYIDGGEFSYASGSNIAYQYSSTLLAIDLSSDWTNSSVNIRSNYKPSGVPDLDDGGIWVDQTNNLLYTGFAGRQSTFGDNSYQEYGLWSFAPDGQGGGTWKNLNSTTDSKFTTQVRPFSALVGSGNGVGYMLGGFAVNQSSPDVRDGASAVSGLVTYDYTSKKLSNSTVTGIKNGGIVQMGGAHFVPNFGPQGILVTFGGDRVGIKQAGDDSLLDSSSVRVYDPATGTWYKQATSGNIPEARKEFCMTGVASNNETYEIFVYAGWDGNLGTPAIPFDEVYVLSLPSFNWFKADYLAENPRHALTCEHIGGGQIVTIGGVNTTQNGPDDLYADVFNTADQFTQGLGVFDLNTMAWSTSYSSEQTTYGPAASIQQYYASHSRTPDFTSNGLQQLMSVQNFTSAATGSPSSGAGSSGSSSKSSSNTGAIAGGVVGGVVVLALVAGAAIFFVRRRKKKQATGIGAGTGSEGDFAQEMPGHAHERQEMADTPAPGTPMLRGNKVQYAKYTDTPANVHHEMPANDIRHELV